MSIQSLMIGAVHTFFGVALIGLQISCHILQHYYQQWGLFEGRFSPGSWLGSVIFITGIIGIVHGCSDPTNVQRYRRLRAAVIVLNIIVAILALIMLGLAIGWRLLDPEGFLFTDCEYPFVPWIYYFAPHCEVQYHVKILGATMMAIACFEIVFGFLSAAIIRQVDTNKIRRPY